MLGVTTNHIQDFMMNMVHVKMTQEYVFLNKHHTPINNCHTKKYAKGEAKQHPIIITLNQRRR